jgi:hypothetical protein
MTDLENLKANRDKWLKEQGASVRVHDVHGLRRILLADGKEVDVCVSTGTWKLVIGGEYILNDWKGFMEFLVVNL